jgi:hypothetical protein
MSSNKNKETEYQIDRFGEIQEIEDFDAPQKQKVDGALDPLGLMWSPSSWRKSKLRSFEFLQRMSKKQNSVMPKTMLVAEENAKKLLELWRSQDCTASDIEDFLKLNPVDTAWYLVAIFDNFEMNGIAKGVKTVRTGIAKGGAKAKSEKGKKGIAMNKIKKLWLEELEKPVKTFKSKSHFAAVMQYRFLDTTAELLEDRKKPILKSAKQIAENCTQWEDAKNSENFGRAA